MPQIFGCTPANDQHSFVVINLHFSKRDIRPGLITLSLHVRIPSRLEVVHDEMKPALFIGSYMWFVASFLEPMISIPCLVAFATIARDKEYFFHIDCAFADMKYREILPRKK